ncbi:MAG: hypothetical protein EOO82_03140 [Oxalobacteraceae bacterium]|nr:MAG: hypothetical protein EOO82_03140 [Oxalobacteraceae bacterium]
MIRLLETLIATGYVYKLEESSLYGVTARTLSLSSGYEANSRIVQLARTSVEKLRADIGWPSNLAVFVEADAAMSIAYTNRSVHGMSMPGRLGARLPLLVTSVGMAFLAHQDPSERSIILDRLRASKSAWDTDPAHWIDLDERISNIRTRGYALAEDSYLQDLYDSKIWAVAVPIIVNGRVTAALSTMILQNAGTPHRLLKQVLEPLEQTARTIGEQIMADANGSSAAGC